MAPSKEKLLRLAHVARRYYLEDWKQIDIARELGVSRPLVSRMLGEARELGVVQITVYEPGEESAVLLDRLRLSTFYMVNICKLLAHIVIKNRDSFWNSIFHLCWIVSFFCKLHCCRVRS